MSYNHDWEPINWKDYLIALVMAIVVVGLTWMATRGM